MADFFTALIERFHSLPAEKRRYRIAGIVGLLLIAVMVIPGSPHPTPVAYVQPDTKKQSPDKQALGQILTAASGRMRDPFAVPDDFTAKPEKGFASVPHDSASLEQMPPALLLREKEPPSEEMPLLTGIIRDSKTQLAVISYKGISRTYRTGQAVGSYRLERIEDKSVIIRGGQGERVLQLGR